MSPREIVAALEQQGWQCVRARRKSHWKCYSPEGKMVVMASTPSDRRSWLNARSLLRREGADL